MDERAFRLSRAQLGRIEGGGLPRAGVAATRRSIAPTAAPREEGQRWNLAPGNLYGKPLKLTIGDGKGAPSATVLDQRIAPIPPPKVTQYIRRVRIESELLSKFWGRPMRLGANILLPEGFAEHPEGWYPLAVFHGHFPADFGGFRTRASRPEPEAGLQRMTSACRLQPHSAGRGVATDTIQKQM